MYTGSSGLQLAYLSGAESDFVSDSTHFNSVDIGSLTDVVKNDTKFKGVDILITSQWPKGVEKYASEIVSEINFWIKPDLLLVLIFKWCFQQKVSV